MKNTYTTLFMFAVIANNPFASTAIGVWVVPKVLMLSIICSLNTLIILMYPKTENNFGLSRLAWHLFLASGLLSSMLSPLPYASIIGVGHPSDGLLYWFLVSVFCLTNQVVLSKSPELLQSQMRGFIYGTIASSSLAIVQSINPDIDYTIHNLSISQFQPMGLFSHKSYNAFISLLGSLCIYKAWKNYWLPFFAVMGGLSITLAAIMLSDIRGVLLAAAFAWIWILFRSNFHKRVYIFAGILLIIGSVSIAQNSLNRDVKAIFYTNKKLKIIAKNITSDRIHLWQNSFDYIDERPLFGWGFGGFGIAEGRKHCRRGLLLYIRPENHVPYCQRGNMVYPVKYVYVKAHNFLLDDLVSVDILGTTTKSFLLLSYTLNFRKSNDNTVAQALTIAYLSYLFTWFDCAQLTHFVHILMAMSSVNDSPRNRFLVTHKNLQFPRWHLTYLLPQMPHKIPVFLPVLTAPRLPGFENNCRHCKLPGHL